MTSRSWGFESPLRHQEKGGEDAVPPPLACCRSAPAKRGDEKGGPSVPTAGGHLSGASSKQDPAFPRRTCLRSWVFGAPAELPAAVTRPRPQRERPELRRRGGETLPGNRRGRCARKRADSDAREHATARRFESRFPLQESKGKGSFALFLFPIEGWQEGSRREGNLPAAVTRPRPQRERPKLRCRGGETLPGNRRGRCARKRADSDAREHATARRFESPLRHQEKRGGRTPFLPPGPSPVNALFNAAAPVTPRHRR